MQLLEALDVRPDCFGEESFQRFGERWRIGVSFSEDEMLDLLGMKLAVSLEDSEGKHGGDDELVLFEESSSSEVE